MQQSLKFHYFQTFGYPGRLDYCKCELSLLTFYRYTDFSKDVSHYVFLCTAFFQNRPPPSTSPKKRHFGAFVRVENNFLVFVVDGIQALQLVLNFFPKEKLPPPHHVLRLSQHSWLTAHYLFVKEKRSPFEL